MRVRLRVMGLVVIVRVSWWVVRGRGGGWLVGAFYFVIWQKAAGAK